MQLDGTKPFLFIGQLGRNHLIVQATRRLYPFCKDYYDGNWIETHVEITAGSFRGTFKASLRAEEFLSFRDELCCSIPQRLLQPRASRRSKNGLR
jgi:hypothetical protein